MDNFKKQPLKFSSSECRRAYRHAETLKTRENSRFKRLSMIRSCNESVFLEDLKDLKSPASASPLVLQNTEKDGIINSGTSNKNAMCVTMEMQSTCTSPMTSHQNVLGKSRIEMLKKFKEEKLLKKELEKQKRKVFYVGAKPPSPVIKIAVPVKSIQKPTSRLGSTFSSKSTNKVVAPSSSAVSSSGIPYNFKAAASAVASKLPKSAKFGNIPIPIKNPDKPAPNPAVKVNAPKPISSLKKQNTPTFKKPTVPSSVVCNKNTTNVSKQLSGSNKIKTMPTVPRAIKANEKVASKPSYQSNAVGKQINGIVKAAPGRNISTASTKVPLSNKICEKKVLHQNNFRGSSFPKSGVSQFPNKPNSKVGIPSKVTNTSCVKIPSKPIIKGNVKSAANLCMVNNLKVSDVAKNSSGEKAKTREKPNVSKTANNTEKVNKLLDSGKKEEKTVEISQKDLVNPRSQKESETLSQKTPSVIFSCDVSAISNSFAPQDFEFQPEMFSSLFVDDVFETVEDPKTKYLSRTSTPSKKVSKDSSFSFKFPNPPSEEILLTKNEGEQQELVNVDCNKPKKNVNPFKEQMSPVDSILDLQSSDILINDDYFDEIDNEKNLLPDILEERANKDSDSASSPNSEKPNVPKDLPDEKLKFEAPSVMHTTENANEEVMQLNSENEKPISGLCEDEQDNSSKQRLSNLDNNRDNFLSDITSDEQNMVQNARDFKCTEFLTNVGVRKKHKDAVDDDSNDFDLDEIKMIIEMEKQRIEDITGYNFGKNEDTSSISKLQSVSHRKSAGSFTKRVSILKNVSVLNSISEVCDESNLQTSKTPRKSFNKSLSSIFTPRRSARLSSSAKMSQVNNPVQKENSPSVLFTPRRSLRLQQAASKVSKDVLPEVVDSCSSYQSTPRRSLRLISLNTPESVKKLQFGKTNITENFEKLRINSDDTQNQTEFLIDDENSPELQTTGKGKKVSLLYSPNRRKSVQKSVDCDLMVFSPSS